MKIERLRLRTRSRPPIRWTSSGHTLGPLSHAEKLRITQYMLSPYSASLIDKRTPNEKLVNDLKRQVEIRTALRKRTFFHLKHDLVLVRVNLILKFRQWPWAKLNLDFNTHKRREEKSSFLQSLYKSLNNMVFGKKENRYLSAGDKLYSCQEIYRETEA